MALQDAVERLQYHARLVTGVKVAPDNIDPSVTNNDLSIISYAGDGRFGTEAAAQGRDFHNLKSLIIFNGSDTLNLELRAEGVLESYVNKLRNDPTLNGKVDTINGEITYVMRRESENNSYRLMIEITIPVKIRPVF